MGHATTMPELAGVQHRYVDLPGLRMHVPRSHPARVGPHPHGSISRPAADDADDLTIEVVQGASHFIPDEQPDAVVEKALELFARA